MSEKGYYRIDAIHPNIFRDATLLEIVEQLRGCGYRCEAGALENNLAFRELERRANEHENDFYVLAEAGEDIEDGSPVAFGDDWLLFGRDTHVDSFGLTMQNISAGAIIKIGVENNCDVFVTPDEMILILSGTFGMDRIALQKHNAIYAAKRAEIKE